MPEGNGDYLSRFERLERLAERQSEQIGELIEHARIVDRHIEELRGAISETNQGTRNLLSSVRDLIDRIPPENLR